MINIKPAHKKNNIAIAFAANEEYVIYTAVTIRSIIDNASDSNNYDIVILYTEISDENIIKIISMADAHANVSIRFVDISELLISFNAFTKSVYTGTKYTQEAYYRLLIPSIMPSYEKVLYLDGDMLALTDVAELFNTDISGYMLASSRDYCGIGNCYIPGDNRREYREKILGLKNIDDYFISGMLIFNVRAFNERYSCNDLLSFAMSREWRQHDQDVLNVLCEGKTLILDAAWDVVKGYGDSVYYLPEKLYKELFDSLENTKIVHFAGPRKPWVYNNADNSDDFWKCAAGTPYFWDLFNHIENNGAYKCSIIELVYGKSPACLYTKNDLYLYYGDKYIDKLSKSPVNLQIMEFENGICTLEGYACYYGIEGGEHVKVYISLNGKLVECERVNRNVDMYRFGRIYQRGTAFRVSFRMQDSVEKYRFRFYIKVYGQLIKNENVVFGRFAKINKAYANQYFIKDARMAFADPEFEGNVIEIRKCGRKGHYLREMAYVKEMYFSLRRKGYKKLAIRALCYRLWYDFYKIISKFLKQKKIWLISDREMAGGDNGEALFEYLRKNPVKGVKPIFAVSKNSADYRRIKKYGKVVNVGHIRYKMLYIMADKLISAHAEGPFLFPLPQNEFSDICNKDFIFLQHGITKDEISSVYSRYLQNMRIFITSVKSEYYNILADGNYGCDGSVLKLTGMPRYDKLTDDKKKVITIMPTWRRNCLHLVRNNRWLLNKNFEETEYFKGYHGLLSDKAFIDSVRSAGYKINFVVHDLMADTLPYFEDIEGVEIIGGKDKDYRKIFAETALLVTDYSSVAFDFSYLGKPLIYWQFDKDMFFGTHLYKAGYFNYETDGMGEVVYGGHGQLADRILWYINNGCAVPEEYEKRINDFFFYRDKQNCRRVVEEILSLKK